MGALTELDGMTIGLIYTLLLAAGIAFAFLLQTSAGHWLESEYMWAVVVIGVVIVLAGLALLVPWPMIEMLFLAFAAVGLPIIVRAFYNKRKATREMLARMRE